MPRERLVIRTAQGPVPHEHTLEWEATLRGTTMMRLRTRATPIGLQALLTPAMTKSFEREGRRDLENLKRLMEAASLLA